ncbi:hypothetical protein RKE25_22105 (plasmid) [Dyella sp. BiH032]|uniref:hypothetical protein n=1 Tax=Dyella sp. BiH032 TaxID=3075430 RepID=UPI0028933B97|nr:hypothetical protein [Dyella sp. BiH032]WNL48425.1 hypothetical protein RKE25_22105 [Dyella sp. BiH032]
MPGQVIEGVGQRHARVHADDGHCSLQDALALEQARRAALWLTVNKDELTLGREPTIRLAPDMSLAELEEFGRAGCAVKVASENFGELWWCDPEGRRTELQEFLLWARGHRRPVTVSLRFARPSELGPDQRQPLNVD